MPKYTANIENKSQLRNKTPTMEPDKLFWFLRVFVVVVVCFVSVVVAVFCLVFCCCCCLVFVVVV